MAQRAVDSFNRSSAASLGSLWTNVASDVTTFELTSSAAWPAADQDAASFYKAVTWPSNQYSQITLTFSGKTYSADCGPGVGLRMSSTGYYRVIASTAAANNISFARKNNSSYTFIANKTSTMSGAHTWYADIVGSSMTCAIDGVQVGTAVTDVSISSGSAGVAYSGEAGGSTTYPRSTGWTGGDFTTVTLPFFVGQNIVATGASSAFGPTRPVDSTTNDILIMHILRRQNSAEALSLPAGWSTLTRGTHTTPNPDLNVELAWKRANSTENSSYTVTWATSITRLGCITAWRGVDSTTSVPITQGAWTAAASSVPTASAVTVPDANSLLIGTWGSQSTNNPSSGSATALTLASTSNAETVWYELRTSSGTSSAKNIRWATSTTFVSQLIALTPTSTSTGGAPTANPHRFTLMGAGL